MQDAAPGPGYLVAGRYRLLDTVGKGGMGVVWRAHDETLNRTVAVKQLVITPQLPDEERDILRERVLREARAAARLHDPAAVTVYDVVTDGDSPYLVMELVDASSLAEVVRDDGPLPPARAARIGLAVLGALEAAHAAGILHRDVKPGNVMVCANGRVLLTDFGIASTEGDTSITQTGLLLGSPAYIAPERAQGGPGGPESDLWALGATLYTAVEGTPAYDAEGALATLSAVVEGRRRPAQRAGALLPVLDAMLATDPRDRPDAIRTRRLLEAAIRNAEATPSAPDPRAPEFAAAQTEVYSAAALASYAPPAEHVREDDTQVFAPGLLGFESGQPQATTPGRVRRRRRRRPLVTSLVLLVVVTVIAVGVLAAAGVFRRTGGNSLGGGGIPVGWVQDNEGNYSIYHPSDWTRQSVPGGGSAYGLDSQLYERVGQISPPTDPLAAVMAVDAGKVAAKQTGYHLLQIKNNGADEADIQWTETESDGINYELLERAYLSNNRLFTLTFFAETGTWTQALPDFEAISGTFQALG